MLANYRNNISNRGSGTTTRGIPPLTATAAFVSTAYFPLYSSTNTMLSEKLHRWRLLFIFCIMASLSLPCGHTIWIVKSSLCQGLPHHHKPISEFETKLCGIFKADRRSQPMNANSFTSVKLGGNVMEAGFWQPQNASSSMSVNLVGSCTVSGRLQLLNTELPIVVI